MFGFFHFIYLWHMHSGILTPSPPLTNTHKNSICHLSQWKQVLYKKWNKASYTHITRMECGCCVKLVRSLPLGFDSQTKTTSDRLPSFENPSAHAEAGREFLPFLPATDVHMQKRTCIHKYIRTFLRSVALPRSLSSILRSGHKRSHSCSSSSSRMNFTTIQSKRGVYKWCNVINFSHPGPSS